MPSLLDSVKSKGPIVDVRQLNYENGLNDFKSVANTVSTDTSNGFWSTAAKWANYIWSIPSITPGQAPGTTVPATAPVTETPPTTSTTAPTLPTATTTKPFGEGTTTAFARRTVSWL
jgi:hypothetical protein